MRSELKRRKRWIDERAGKVRREELYYWRITAIDRQWLDDGMVNWNLDEILSVPQSRLAKIITLRKNMFPTHSNDPVFSFACAILSLHNLFNIIFCRYIQHACARTQHVSRNVISNFIISWQFLRKRKLNARSKLYLLLYSYNNRNSSTRIYITIIIIIIWSNETFPIWTTRVLFTR